MAKEKLVKNITSRDEDFAQWYTDVVREANLCDYSSVKGCMNYLPNGYAIWELIQADLDRRFKETGVENVYLPVLIPESLLEKEADHVEGFAPEVAWVTHGGMERLQERLCVRPTSETLFCDLWAKTVKSYRDLPKVWNQWNSVLRWEKTTRPFLRSREFLWQEGHTIHATYEEAEERTKQMWRVYRDFAQDVLAIPVVSGRKTESEKFAGAQDTYTIEALMHDGKALQSATSHFFGSSFPSAFGIQYSDKNNELHEVYETSWGLSTRIIGALIMVHGDDSGLVIPPRIAPVQTMIIPIAQHKEGVLDKANELVDTLKAAGYKSTILTKHLDGSSADRRSLESRHVSRSDRKISRTIRQLSYAVIQERRSLFLWMSLQQNLLKFLRQCRTICSKEQKHSLILISMKQQQWMR